MPYFRRKPLEVEARQLTADNAKDICDWIHSALVRSGHTTYEGDSVRYTTTGEVIIYTREGPMEASIGDWIIQEPNPTETRLFYPCKPEIFESGYDLIEEETHVG